MRTPCSCRYFTLVSPRRNHSSSYIIDLRCSFFVVRSGKPLARSKRIWLPNTLFVPVPVRSVLVAPSVRMRFRRLRYCCIVVILLLEWYDGEPCHLLFALFYYGAFFLGHMAALYAPLLRIEVVGTVADVLLKSYGCALICYQYKATWGAVG